MATKIKLKQVESITASDVLTSTQLDAVNSGITAVAVQGMITSVTKSIGGVPVTRIPGIYLCQTEDNALVASTADTASLFIVKGA